MPAALNETASSRKSVRCSMPRWPKQAAALEAATAEIRAHAAAEHNRVARLIEDEAACRAERDRRYANRKARQA